MNATAVNAMIFKTKRLRNVMVLRMPDIRLYSHA